MSKLDIDAYLSNKKGKPVNKVFYWILVNLIAPFVYRPFNIEFHDNVGEKNIKGPFIVVANHTSRCDWMYVSSILRHHPLNYMVSYTEFHRSHMHGIFRFMRVIPKKNFISDMHAIKEVFQVIKAGGNVAFMPEGKSSISGTNQPVINGTGKLFKHCNVPVYVVHISGGYMSNTQWNIANRYGKVVVSLDKLLDKDDLNNYSDEQIEEKLNDAIYNDDFEWNKTARVAYKGNDTVAEKLEEHLFWCPKCHSEFKMKGVGNTITCSSCGNSIKINEFYDLLPNSNDAKIPQTMSTWYHLQRRSVYYEIKNNENFVMEEEVELGYQPTDRYVPKAVTSIKCGHGKIKLTREGFSFDGMKDGEPFSFFIPALNIISVVFETDSSCFGIFNHNNLFYEFIPSRPVSTKWQIAVEEVHRLAGGKWVNNLKHQQWIYQDDLNVDNYYKK